LRKRKLPQPVERKSNAVKKKKDISFKRLLMLGKTQVKYIQSLRQSRYRHLHGAYVIEGEKIVGEYLARNYPLSNIYAVDEWMNENFNLLKSKKVQATTISPRELKTISALTTPNKVVAVAMMPAPIAPDAIRDPGNMGTIIRTADWFGADSIVCSADCADAYNPKVVQSAMGSLARMKISYMEDLTALKGLSHLPLYAATLNGANIFRQALKREAIILIGNESQGLPQKLLNISTQRISIPRYGEAESLNAAIAAGVMMAWMRRQEPVMGDKT
jgi:TrmH family RNA methyltransferase